MNFLKKLFEFLIRKDHMVSKKVHTLGAVLVTACLVSVVILGANGYASTIHQENNAAEQNQIAKEEELQELVVMEEEQEDFELQSEIFESEMIDIMYVFTSTAMFNAEAKELAIGDNELIALSTAPASNNEEEIEELVTISVNDVDVTPNREAVSLTESDYQVLLTIVEAEVGTEDLYTRMMIANTIINRMQHEYYPDTIEEVVFQNDGKVYQFSPILDGRYWEVKVSAKTIEAVNNALAGYDNSEGALAFVNREITDPSIMQWFDDNLIFVQKYGKVEYFTF